MRETLEEVIALVVLTFGVMAVASLIIITAVARVAAESESRTSGRSSPPTRPPVITASR